MPSLLALTGLNVDHPFPELGTDAAERRRAIATTLLLAAISHAQKVGAEALIFVGGLFDDRGVSPQSVSYLVHVLDAYPGRVLIAPGTDSEGTYSATNWGPRTYVWSTADFAAAPLLLGADVLGRAGQRWPPTLPAARSEGGVTVLVSPDLAPELSASWVGGDRARHVITIGSSEALLDGVTVLAPINPCLGEPWGRAALLTYDDSAVTDVEWVSLTTQPSAQTIEIDVSALMSTDELKVALDRAITAAPEWSVVRLVGDLPHGVQLPSTAEYTSPRDDVALETDDVGFEFAQPERADHTALAEFVRSLCEADADEQERHQAIALGIAALVPESNRQDTQ